MVTGKLIDTEILVVIGYTFPFFNREIDRKIINPMKLKKVYIQSPDAENIKERLQAVLSANSKVEIVLKSDVAQFVLPNEL